MKQITVNSVHCRVGRRKKKNPFFFNFGHAIAQESCSLVFPNKEKIIKKKKILNALIKSLRIRALKPGNNSQKLKYLKPLEKL